MTPQEIARAFIAGSEAGELPEELLAPDMTASITTRSGLDRETYRGMVRLMSKMTAGSLKFEIDAITAEDDRVLVEAHSTATLINDEDYANTYVFSLRIREGQIASVAEHFNALVVQEKLIPLMSAEE